MKEKLFIYGTLKEPRIQKEIFGKIITGIPDILENYKESKIEIEGGVYPLIVPAPNNLINGLVILLTPEELESADKYETDAYTRKEVILKRGVKAWVYLKS